MSPGLTCSPWGRGTRPEPDARALTPRLSYAMVDKARWTASKWPKDRPAPGPSTASPGWSGEASRGGMKGVGALADLLRIHGPLGGCRRHRAGP